MFESQHVERSESDNSTKTIRVQTEKNMANNNTKTMKTILRHYLPLGKLCAGLAMVLPSLGISQSGPPPPNDQFAQAAVVQEYGDTNSAALDEAAMEPGEPPHLDGRPCKSAWWRWPVPVRGYLEITNATATVSNLTLAIYSGDTLESLSLLSKGANEVRITATGSAVYYLAAALPAEAAGTVELRFSLTPRLLYSPVPGNLLCEPSFEDTGLDFTCWQVQGSLCGGTHDLGGADPPVWYGTWPVIDGRQTMLMPYDVTNVAALATKLTNRADAVVAILVAPVLQWH